MAEGILLDDDDGHAGRSEVFLRACVDALVFAYVELTAEDVGAHVAHHRNGGIVVLAGLGSVDGVVGSIVEIVGIRGDYEILRNIVEFIIFGGSNNFYLAEELCLFDGVGSPCTGVDIGCFLLQKVERNHAELQAGTAAEEKHMIALRDVEKLFGQSCRLVYNGLEFLATVRNLKQRKTGVCKVNHCVCCLLDGVRGEDARTRIEIVFLHDEACRLDLTS